MLVLKEEDVAGAEEDRACTCKRVQMSKMWNTDDRRINKYESMLTNNGDGRFE